MYRYYQLFKNVPGLASDITGTINNLRTNKQALYIPLLLYAAENG